jgi:hypothetical protein
MIVQSTTATVHRAPVPIINADLPKWVVHQAFKTFDTGTLPTSIRSAMPTTEITKHRSTLARRVFVRWCPQCVVHCPVFPMRSSGSSARETRSCYGR